MGQLADNLSSIAEHIRAILIAKDEAREKILPLYRESIRYSSSTIRAVHRREFTEAEEQLKIAGKCLKEAERAALPFKEFNYSGFMRDAQKEFAEASITLALIKEEPLPAPEELDIDPAAYLNGIGEAVGELRRYILDSIRRGDLSRGEQLLAAMDDIYNVLVTMDFPDAVTGGLRRTTDMVRGVLERTRGDLTLVIRQKEFEDRLKEFGGQT